MNSQTQPQLHFVLIPLMAQGHLIPMIDMAKMFAQRNVIVTIVTTPQNAIRFDSIINRAIESGLPIRLLQLPFPSLEAGLPEGCENLDTLPSGELIINFLNAVCMMQKPLEQFLEQAQPPPSCMVSDRLLTWTADAAVKFGIPRVVFDGTSCFALLCTHNLETSKILEAVSDTEPFLVPGLPDQIQLTKTELPGALNPNCKLDLSDFRKQIKAQEGGKYGVVVNTFEELEPRYVEEYRKAKGDRVWCIGPVSLCNKEELDMAQRGNKACIDRNHCLEWLNSWPNSSVVYACLGSLCRLTPLQLIEIGLGLEASGRPFIWVLREGKKTKELLELISRDGFEQRIQGRGLLIRGWAPQVLILSHPAVGAFLTHCGWNSTLEGVCAGVPLIACPLFAEQFYNEKFIVQILGIGVGIDGARVAIQWNDEEKLEVFVKREEVTKAVDKVMDEGKEGEEKRKRAREVGEMAKRAMEEGGSSFLNIKLLIEDIKRQAIVTRAKA